MARLANIALGNSGMQPSVSIDWRGARKALSAPRGLGLIERATLWWHGRSDAKHRRIYKTEEGWLMSPYLRSEVEQTNLAIASEWKECGARSAEIEARLKQIEREKDALHERYEDVSQEREERLAEMRARQRTGDANVTEHLKTRRQANRERPILDAYAARESEIVIAVKNLELSAIPCRESLKSAIEIAQYHEMIHRHRYMMKLSMYAHGASPYYRVNQGMLSDSPLSSEARDEYFRVYGSYAQFDDV